MKFDFSGKTFAVLVLDCQRLFIAADGPFENRTGQPVIDALNRFLPGCRARGVPIIFSNYMIRPDRCDAGLLAGQPWVEQGLLGEDSEWIGLDPRIEVRESDIHVRHNRPSAFFASDLDAVLGGLGTDALIICGLSVNNAVGATARDAFARDLPAIVVRECTGAAPWESEIDVYFRILDTWTAEVLDVEETLARIDATRGSVAPR
jgi:bifunctional isochorismate lyase/aryl carrier protein